MMKNQIRVFLGRIVKWLDQPSVLLITPFLLLIPGYRPVSVEYLYDLSRIEQRLKISEVGTYFPAELKALSRAIDNVRHQYRPTIRPIDILCTLPFLESRIPGQLARGAELAGMARREKSELDSELDLVIEFVGRELAATEGSPFDPELGAIRNRIRESSRQFESFESSGTYARNLVRMRELSRLYSDFKERWIRYNGGTVPDRRSLESLRDQAARLAALEPGGLFVLIDTASNRLYLRRDREILMEAECSTGSGYQLVQNGRKWTFETPRGEFKIERKIENPIWRKPDWAFIESGRPLPKREDLRLEDSVLGDYAIGFGGPYFIHGTLYTRLLGEPVTHGCVRLGPGDLETLYRLADIGTPVFIY